MAFVTRVGSGATLDTAKHGTTDRQLRTSVRNELVIADPKYQMVADGRVYIAGIGIEDTPIADQATLADTTPMLALQAPDSGTVVIPLAVICDIDVEGGDAVAEFDVVFDDADRNCTGTNFTDIRNARSDQPNTPKASALTTVTTDAGDGITLMHLEWPTDILSVEAIDEKSGSIRWTPEKDMGGVPLFLVNGGSLLVYSVTGTTRTSYVPLLVWAEYNTDEAFST